eukprot:Hpha_TRINITY_DN16263_c7_g1::TRINITY_DN16263_c7_g1_i1::g.15689::m.15689
MPWLKGVVVLPRHSQSVVRMWTSRGWSAPEVFPLLRLPKKTESEFILTPSLKMPVFTFASKSIPGHRRGSPSSKESQAAGLGKGSPKWKMANRLEREAHSAARRIPDPEEVIKAGGHVPYSKPYGEALKIWKGGDVQWLLRAKGAPPPEKILADLALRGKRLDDGAVAFLLSAA